MTIAIAFDVYGTLIDVHGVIAELQKFTAVGDKATAFSHTWRDKQLEYSFRRALMQKYEPFSICTSEALDYTCAYYRIDLTQAQKRDLLDCYGRLPAFDDVEASLLLLREKNFGLYAFSNGTAEAVNGLLMRAGIRNFFHGLVSVDDLRSFKPSPAVYSHFLRQSGSIETDAWMVSSNPFDVIGALSAGMRAVWLKRSDDAIFDPWGVEPTATIESLDMLDKTLSMHCSS